jgi:hypothetical protein
MGAVVGVCLQFEFIDRRRRLFGGFKATAWARLRRKIVKVVLGTILVMVRWLVRSLCFVIEAELSYCCIECVT